MLRIETDLGIIEVDADINEIPLNDYVYQLLARLLLEHQEQDA